jgi:hypothetical protein
MTKRANTWEEDFIIQEREIIHAARTNVGGTME